MIKTLIIAEAGVNHNGDIKKAIKLIDAAKNCGADIVKFQTYSSIDTSQINAPKAKYQLLRGRKKNESMYKMLKRYELNFKEFKHLNYYCKKKKIEFEGSQLLWQSAGLPTRA